MMINELMTMIGARIFLSITVLCNDSAEFKQTSILFSSLAIRFSNIRER